MRICDKCGNPTVVEVLTKQTTDEKIELCSMCAAGFEDWRKPINEATIPPDLLGPTVPPDFVREKVRPGRPRKDGSN